ncbi:MAG: signal peptide peptidase SppA [Erythrobacter sp.]
MSFAGKVWRLLVGVKDALALAFLLLFFAALFALLSASPSPGQIRDGALLLDLDGYVVEEKSQVDPLDALLSQQAPVGEFPVHELVQVLNEAATDDRIEAVVLDLSRFLGGGQVHLQAVGEAIDRVRAADKDVLSFAVGYSDDGMQLAAHASEIWLDPMGGAVITGPGGTFLFYDELLDKLKVNARVYKVGTYKAATEPFTRSDLSEESRENISGLYAVMWEEWQANVKKARPGMDIDKATKNPAQWIEESSGDLANAALAAGLVDKLGDQITFGERVAELVGEDSWDSSPGSFAHTELEPYLTDTAPDTPGRAIGIITIAGDVVDGQAGPAVAGGDRIAKLLDDALDDDLAALVVRVETPGGSTLAAEVMRRAIVRHKDQGIPIAISMGNIAASAGYWVSTPGDRIFAQPETITGSIGVFSIVPTFEGTAELVGLNADGIRTTTLSGQPDLVAGFPPEIDAILQSLTDDIYSDFLGVVAESRGMSTDKVDGLAQGRVWDGGSARQVGLVDQFGGVEDAAAWAAKEAGLADGEWHVVRLGEQQSRYDSLIRQMMVGDTAQSAVNRGLFTDIAQQNTNLSARVLRDLQRLTSTQGVQAYCLECPREADPANTKAGTVELSGWLTILGGMLPR